MTNHEDLAGPYTKGVLRSLKLRATWLPNETVRLGSVGFLRDGVFHERQHLVDFGVTFKVQSTKNTSGFEYKSSSGVKLTFKAQGETSELFQNIGSASAGALVQFSKSGASILSVPTCTVSRISDIRTVERQIAKLPDWDKKYVIVTKIVSADSATVLISNSKKSRVELRAGASAPMTGVDLVDLGAGFERASSHGVGIEIVSKGGLTPLYLAESYGRSVTEAVRRKSRKLKPARRAAKRAPAKKAAAKRAPAKKAAKKRAPARRSPSKRVARRR